MGIGPNSQPPIDTTPSYVPSFPFYDAEPYWPKRNSGSGGGSGSGGANIGEMLPYYYHVSTRDAAHFFLSTSPFTDVSGKTVEQLMDMSISCVTERAGEGELGNNNVDVHVSDGLYFCCLMKTTSSINNCKVASGGYLDDHEWGSYSLDGSNFVYVTGPTNIGSDIPDDLDFIMIGNSGIS